MCIILFLDSTWLGKNFEILIVDHLQLLWMHVAGVLKGPQGPCPKGYALLSAGHDGKGNTVGFQKHVFE